MLYLIILDLNSNLVDIIILTLNSQQYKTNQNNSLPNQHSHIPAHLDSMPSNYQNIKKIGEGEHGSVYMVEKKNSHKNTKYIDPDTESELFAMKKIPLSKNYFDFQAKLLLSLNHPNVIQVNQVYQEKEHLILILELAEQGDLHQFIKRNYPKKVPQPILVSWLCQLALGLYYLHHENNIIHRDIKSRNILVKENGILKLADFGVAKKLQKGEDFAKTSVGTPCYLSPESINLGRYNNKSDVWSLGCLLYEICTGKKPFLGESLGALLNNIVNNSFQEISQSYSYWLRQLITQMLAKDPQKRPTISGILEIPQIKKEFKALQQIFIDYKKIDYPEKGPKTTKYLDIDDRKLNTLKIFSQSLKTTKNQKSIKHQIQQINNSSDSSENKQKVRDLKNKNAINDFKIHIKNPTEPNKIKFAQRKPINSIIELKSSEYMNSQKFERKMQFAKGANISCSLNKISNSSATLISNFARKVERDKFLDKSLKSIMANRTKDKIQKKNGSKNQ